MHEALKTNKDAIQSVVKQYADPIRHGNWASAQVTTSAMRYQMLVLTRGILEKYMNYFTEDA